MAEIIPFPSLSEPLAFPVGSLPPQLEPLSPQDLASLVGEHEPEASVPALMAALESDEDHLFEQALAVVSVFRVTSPLAELEPVENRLLERLFDAGAPLGRRLAIAEAFASLLGRPAHNRVLLPWLEHEHADHRRVAAIALGFPDNPSAFGPLCRALHDSSGEVCEAAVASLSATGHPEAAAAYADALHKGPGRPVKLAILRRLRHLEADEAEELALPFAADEDEEARLAVALALDGVPGPAARAALAALCHDADARVRVTALSALERLGDPDDLPLARGLLRDPDPRVRRVAAEAVQRLKRAPAAPGPAAV